MVNYNICPRVVLTLFFQIIVFLFCKRFQLRFVHCLCTPYYLANRDSIFLRQNISGGFNINFLFKPARLNQQFKPAVNQHVANELK